MLDLEIGFGTFDRGRIDASDKTPYTHRNEMQAMA